MNWKTKEGKVISIIESHTLMETGTYRIKVVNSGHNYEESMDHGPILATIRLSQVVIKEVYAINKETNQ